MVNEANQSDLLQKKHQKKEKRFLKRCPGMNEKWFKMKQQWHLFTTWVSHPDFFIPKKSEGFGFPAEKKWFCEANPQSSALRTRIRKEPRHHHVVMSTIKVIMPAMLGWPVVSFVTGVDGFLTFFSCFFPPKWLSAQQNWPQNWWLETWWYWILWIDTQTFEP